MDKPISLSVKDFLIRKLAIKILTSEKTIEAVVQHQFSSANEAIQDASNKSVEISGFGKLFFNHKKAIKKMDDWLKIEKHLINIINTSPSEQKRKTASAKLEDLNKSIETLKPKINESVTNNGGMEEQPHTTSQVETSDKGNEQGENINM
jgi:hypothetical protein